MPGVGEAGDDEIYHGPPAPPADHTCRRVGRFSSSKRAGCTVRPVSGCALLPDLEQ